MDSKRKENFLQGEQIKRQSVIREDMERHKRTIPEINYLGTHSSRGSAENMGAFRRKKKFQLSNITYINPDIDPKRKEKISFSGADTEDNVSFEKISNVTKEQFSKSTISGLIRVQTWIPNEKKIFFRGRRQRDCVIGEDIERHKRTILEINNPGTHPSRGSAENMGALSPPTRMKRHSCHCICREI
ncbi:hypothetical protein CDAR_501781 [Caerostris darwini]|uniref:Uncharacterized protein n=1 Tax=Caerostris darwini TaxID=1538125 RepID=A0AAV4TQY8_9ARAC|nr:hypothetical protein CDAR_501781 [Caerostris darwini]